MDAAMTIVWTGLTAPDHILDATSFQVRVDGSPIAVKVSNEVMADGGLTARVQAVAEAKIRAGQYAMAQVILVASSDL